METIKNTIRNTIIEYNVSSISDKRSAISWLYNVLTSQIVKVRSINLSDISQGADEGNTSTTISSLLSEKELLDKVTENDTDVISITADYDGKPVVIGIDLRSFRLFVILRNSKKANIDMLKMLLGLS